MAHAKCTRCGTVLSWHAGRGARLADLACHCGGTLRRATNTDVNDFYGVLHSIDMLTGAQGRVRTAEVRHE
jgi:hypothetical protein